MTALRAIGLMSGTSMDGVDVAVIDTDGESVEAFGPTSYRPYSDAERDLLRRSGGRHQRGAQGEGDDQCEDAHRRTIPSF